MKSTSYEPNAECDAKGINGKRGFQFSRRSQQTNDNATMQSVLWRRRLFRWEQREEQGLWSEPEKGLNFTIYLKSQHLHFLINSVKVIVGTQQDCCNVKWTVWV